MIPTNATLAPLEALVDELARCGMRHAVTSPGSRNAPLLLALAADERIRTVSVLDERAAGFVALGMAKATGRPVAVTTTSGTAAANLLPAVVEAREGRVPLIALTADRPPELRDTGAGQAIDQLKLYGDQVKWFVEVGNHPPGRGSAIHHRSLGCRAYFTAAGGRPGPVHLNFPLREPLDPRPEPLDPSAWEGRGDGRPWVQVSAASAQPDPDEVGELARRLTGVQRGAIVSGFTGQDVAPDAARLAAALGWPLLADPTSGARCGPHDRSHVVAHYDALLRAERFVAEHRTELVLRIGDTPTSKPLRAWLARAGQVVVDPHATWHEPTRMAETMLAADPAAACAALAGEVERLGAMAEPGWLESWRRADAVVDGILAEAPDPFEPKVYAALAGSLGDGALVWVSSSMPIRDVETFFPQREERIEFHSNRGANGIDGVVSSAAGAALGLDHRCTLLSGELALLHDLSGLVAASRAEADLTVVCVDNGGGGIFDFLPVFQRADPRLYEEHIATPSGVDLARVAALADMPHAVARTPQEVRVAAARPGLVQVPTDRAANVKEHRAVFARIAEALAS
jgi:2-succinyl-5-enolpyruvyl-6-hydroxy-3-cyclohexene-1-carboxylate synthase